MLARSPATIYFSLGLVNEQIKVLLSNFRSISIKQNVSLKLPLIVTHNYGESGNSSCNYGNTLNTTTSLSNLIT